MTSKAVDVKSIGQRQRESTMNKKRKLDDASKKRLAAIEDLGITI